MKLAPTLSCMFTGCALLACSGAFSMRGVHPAGLPQATQSVAIAFRQLQIPVRIADDVAGYIASGGFGIEKVWGPGPIEQRVDCGMTRDGTPRAALGPVWMSVEAELTPSNDALATARAGASFSRHPTDVQLRAAGEVTIGEDTHGCGLTEEFSREILARAGIHGDGVVDVPGDLRVIAEGGQ